ncbi:hypothetical protein BaRGS_00031989 [Batillaria attramentaria]|uniref:G-protein coupled receptors family 1 profile domain-containing protein n=1 Tax=Batillaria attramentaria TaxID=370345 RepID=A0ABD0JQJ0_9CAEN
MDQNVSMATMATNTTLLSIALDTVTRAGQEAFGNDTNLTLSVNGANSDGCWQLTSVTLRTPLYDQTGFPRIAVTYVNRILHSSLSVLVALLGVFANIINMVVFYKLGLQDRVTFCLFCLAFADMMNLFSYVLRFFDFMIQLFAGFEHILIRRSTPLAVFDGPAGFQQASFALYAFVAVERCLCVVTPFRAKYWLQMRATKCIIGLIFVICAGMGGLISTRYDLQCLYYTDTGRYSHWYVASPYYKAMPELYDVVDGLIQGFLMPLVFLGTVSICTLITVITLRGRARWRQESISGGNTREIEMTKMMMVVSCIYIACTTPDFLHRFLQFLIAEWRFNGPYWYMVTFSRIICDFLINVNSAINIVVYYLQGSRYREMFRGLFCRCCPSALQKNPVHKNNGIRPGGVQGCSTSVTCDTISSNDQP